MIEKMKNENLEEISQHEFAKLALNSFYQIVQLNLQSDLLI